MLLTPVSKKKGRFSSSLIVFWLLSLLVACADEFTATPGLTQEVRPGFPFTPTPSPTARIIPATITPLPTPSLLPTNLPTSNVPIRKQGGILNVGVLASSLTNLNFSPYATQKTAFSQHFERLVWNARLLYRDPVRLDWNPLAARALPIVDQEGRRFTFILRDNLTWSDGTPIVADDYVFAFENAARFENQFAGVADLQRVVLKELDFRTLVFTFDERYTTALQIINLIEPLPARLWRSQSFTAFRQPPLVTSGPFQADPLGLTFFARPDYSLGQPNFEQVRIITFADWPSLIANLKSGSVDWTFEDLAPNLLSQFAAKPQLNVYRWTAQDASQRYVGYNLNNPFLQSKGVRQALNRLLDVTSMVVSFEYGLAAQQPGFLPTSNEFALKSLNPSRFNLRAAVEELKAAKPQDAPLEVIYTLDNENLARYLAQQYEQVGLKVILNLLEEGIYQQRQMAGQYDIDIGTLHIMDALDPDNFKDSFVSNGRLNFTGYANLEVDSLFANAAQSPEKAIRRQLYERLQQIVADDAPVFFLYTLQAYTVMSQNVVVSGNERWQLTWDAFPAYLNWYHR